MPESDVVDIAAQLVLAIGYLHENNIIHGNLQPNNTYIDWNGLLRIGDFSSCQVTLNKLFIQFLLLISKFWFFVES